MQNIEAFLAPVGESLPRVVTTAAKGTAERIGVVGLGYVGLPLCLALARQFEEVTGFDISEARLRELRACHDRTGEIDARALRMTTARLSADAGCLSRATFFVVTVPTPIDEERRPDLRALRAACVTVARHLKRGDMVVFESTVYPGTTEEVCGPILEHHSGLVAGRDFSLGYSPERINPGDRERSVETIQKIVSADSPAALERVARVYERAIHAGVHRAASIRVAECAKVIENIQRDVNIALMNELSLICDRIGISTRDVIEAAGTKWNFAKYRPGLVGGHCIGVDPYYLVTLAERLNVHPEVILAGRRRNEGMSGHVAAEVLRQLVRRGAAASAARVGLFGLTFKPDVPDLRNSKSLDLLRTMQGLGLTVMAHDPLARPDELGAEGIAPSPAEAMWELDMMIVAVGHRAYLEAPDFLARLKPDGILIDVATAFARDRLPEGAGYWAL